MVADGVSMSYADLDARADPLAHRCATGGGRGVGGGSVSAARRRTWSSRLLGVWKAGAAYLPIDPALPAERIAFMLADSGCASLLVSGR